MWRVSHIQYMDKQGEQAVNDLTDNFGRVSMTAAAKNNGINGKTD